MIQFNSIRSKLIALVTAITLPLIVIAIIITQQNYKLVNTSTSLEERQIPTVLYAMRLANLANKTSLLTHSYIVLQDVEYQKERNLIYETELPNLIKELTKLSVGWHHKKEDIKLLKEVSIDLTKLKTAQDEIISLVNSEADKKKIVTVGDSISSEYKLEDHIYFIQKAGQIIDTKTDPFLTEIVTKLGNIVEGEESELEQNIKYIKEQSSSQTFIGGGLLLIGVIVIIILSLRLFKSVLNPINRLKTYIKTLSLGELPEKLETDKSEIGDTIEATNELIYNLRKASEFSVNIGNGHFNNDFKPVSENDVLGNSLLNMKTQLMKIAEEDKKRNWVSDGLAKFSVSLRTNNSNLKSLCDTIISDLVKYIKGNQGSIFILNDSDQNNIHLSLVSCYAYDKKRYLEKDIIPGEGLLGQAYLEKETVYMTSIPNNYVYITSGLGESTAKCLLIVPLKVNDVVEGVMELASFNLMDKEVINFVEKLSENIASVITSVKVSERTQSLLETSQQQSQMMREQEEEMRQSMEELQATQEEIAQRSQEFEEFTNIVNAFTIIIELGPDGTILDVNEKFSQFTGYPRNEIIGKHHTYYVPDEAIVSGAFEELWDDLALGKNIIKDVLRKKKDGTLFWLRASYLPVYDSNGKIKRISCLCYDITQEKKNELDIKEKNYKLNQHLIELSREENELRSKIKILEQQLH